MDAKLQDSEGVVDVKEDSDEKPVFTTNFYIGLDIEHSDAIFLHLRCIFPLTYVV